MMRPTYMFHADRGTAANKRWLAQATLGAGGHYTAHAPTLIENHGDLIPRIRGGIGAEGCALVGFDFPIEIPAVYARLVGVVEFKSFLRKLLLYSFNPSRI